LFGKEELWKAGQVDKIVLN